MAANMKSKQAKGGVNREHHKSLPEKLVFSLLHLLIVLACAWLIYFDGTAELGQVLNKQWLVHDPVRANILFACIVLYWLRHNITLFYLLVRKVEWSEVFGLVSFFAMIEVGFLMIGVGVFRDAAVELNALDALALALLVIGSFLNSFSEMQRKWWKSKPNSKGHCYTEGLFRYSMHINFFGDVVLFAGWALFVQSIWAFGLPLLMLLMFIFMHIPALDVYLSERYGQEFDDYALKTKKLIPFFY